jgi:Polyketide cyclase / dehydrase and lipid transport
MTKRALALCTLVGALSATSAMPGTIRTLEITHENGRYHLVANSFLDAQPEALFDVLTDYDNDAFARISEIYKESGYLPPDKDGTPLVYTVVQGCLLFYCRSMSRVERLEVEKPNVIRTTTLPDRSDFKYSVSEWRLEPEQGGTRVIYRQDVEPDFRVPPFIGPRFLKSTLLRGGSDAIEHLEKLAGGKG